MALLAACAGPPGSLVHLNLWVEMTARSWEVLKTRYAPIPSISGYLATL